MCVFFSVCVLCGLLGCAIDDGVVECRAATSDTGTDQLPAVPHPSLTSRLLIAIVTVYIIKVTKCSVLMSDRLI